MAATVTTAERPSRVPTTTDIVRARITGNKRDAWGMVFKGLVLSALLFAIFILLVLLLDATWSCARKMLKLSPSLQRLPRIMFTPSAPSRFFSSS